MQFRREHGRPGYRGGLRICMRHRSLSSIPALSCGIAPRAMVALFRPDCSGDSGQCWRADARCSSCALIRRNRGDNGCSELLRLSSRMLHVASFRCRYPGQSYFPNKPATIVSHHGSGSLVKRIGRSRGVSDCRDSARVPCCLLVLVVLASSHASRTKQSSGLAIKSDCVDSLLVASR